MYRPLLGLLLALTLTTPTQAALPWSDSQAQPLPTLAPMLERVNPAVVNIATYSTQQQAYNPLMNDPFFRYFFNAPQQQPRGPQRRQQSAGSGVIIDADKGLVVTNHHVIKNADDIQVALVDGRQFKAKLMGSDPDLDIALLEIDADRLTEIPLADSDALRVGDFVVAIGNPFGLGQTVTTGIVSALGRSGLGIEGYENFIQTDASINPGNSGGALVNLKGELVGINTAIIAPAGGNVGIGFAIPTNMANASIKQIRDHGEVRRGTIGVGIQDITPDLQRAFGLENGQQGVLITQVYPDSPADKAGLENGDIIIAVDGRNTTNVGQVRSAIGVVERGEKVKLTLLRNGKKRDVKVTVGDGQSGGGLPGNLHPLLEGAEFEPVQGEGVRVTQLKPTSKAAYAGLRPGDLIIGANRRRVTDMASFNAALAKDRDAVLLHINRSGYGLYLVIR
ncbi:DegQ family serine endoprotease [Simiduia agarivorans]|uniref:Peptidase Do n=1 Tax=Simiduia agarivorans (strain DSM 21679 / JCM 13881 / BCRC 17597 / SA1) TaxID=1117647 RepID=K4L2I5_SIMAS|nr:DegQ family serine endoprotease [Simiduia agarivorans]AFV00403.1 peptidase Do [Simiduia agarivorans SA1 = DSM 21679]